MSHWIAYQGFVYPPGTVLPSPDALRFEKESDAINSALGQIEVMRGELCKRRNRMLKRRVDLLRAEEKAMRDALRVSDGKSPIL